SVLTHPPTRRPTAGPSLPTLTNPAGRTSAVVTTAVSARAACSKASAAVFPKPRTPTSAACGKCSHLGSPLVATSAPLMFVIYAFPAAAWMVFACDSEISVTLHWIRGAFSLKIITPIIDGGFGRGAEGWL